MGCWFVAAAAAVVATRMAFRLVDSRMGAEGSVCEVSCAFCLSVLSDSLPSAFFLRMIPDSALLPLSHSLTPLPVASEWMVIVAECPGL